MNNFHAAIKEADIKQDTKDFLERMNLTDQDLPYEFDLFRVNLQWNEPFAPETSELKTFYSLWEAKVEEEYS